MIPESLSDLVVTDLKKRIVEVIAERTGSFVIGDILQQLEQENIVVKRSAVQHLLLILQHRKYILGTEIREPNKRGRQGKRYQRT